MDISVVICTHNRARLLSSALESLKDQTVGTKRYEVIVVDNRSSDNTKAITQDFHEKNRKVSIQYIREDELGLSIARNTGLRQAAGTWVAYLDDDAIADQHWLERIADTFETVTPQPGAVGGRVEPVWEAPPPKWLEESLYGLLSITPTPPPPGFLVEPRNIIGANMAFPTKLLRDVGGFPIHLGRVGGNLLGNEEVLLLHKIRERGHGVYHHPDIIVRHLVPAERLTFRWQVRRFYWQGKSDALLSNPTPLLLDNIALLTATLLRAIGLAFRLKRKRAVTQLLRAATHAGAISTALQHSKHDTP